MLSVIETHVHDRLDAAGPRHQANRGIAVGAVVEDRGVIFDDINPRGQVIAQAPVVGHDIPLIIGSPAPDQLAAPEGKGHELSPRKGVDLLIIREHLPDALLDSGQIRGRGGASLAKVPGQVSRELE